MIAWSTSLTATPSHVTLFTLPLPTPGPAHTLILATLPEFVSETLRTRMFSTISTYCGYWPREPTLMPWLPVQSLLQCQRDGNAKQSSGKYRFCTRTLVEFGLKLTQLQCRS